MFVSSIWGTGRVLEAGGKVAINGVLRASSNAGRRQIDNIIISDIKHADDVVSPIKQETPLLTSDKLDSVSNAHTNLPETSSGRYTVIWRR